MAFVTLVTLPPDMSKATIGLLDLFLSSGRWLSCSSGLAPSLRRVSQAM